MIKIKISGKTYHSVRIALERKTYNTPKRGQTEIMELKEIPKDLIQLEDLGIIKIDILS